MIFHQLFEKESSSFTYLLADDETKEAIIIDPVKEMIERDYKLIQELGLKLKYILETHIHADHITSSGELRKRTQAQVVLGAATQNTFADILLQDGEHLTFGRYTLEALSTPGHTAGCTCYIVDKMIFTGDTLLVRGCGRTDFQEGSPDKLFESIRHKIFNRPNLTVYPGHDYNGFTNTTIDEEAHHNPRINLEVSKEAFIGIMNNLKLPYPKKMDEAVPANLRCGLIQ